MGFYDDSCKTEFPNFQPYSEPKKLLQEISLFSWDPVGFFNILMVSWRVGAQGIYQSPPGPGFAPIGSNAGCPLRNQENPEPRPDKFQQIAAKRSHGTWPSGPASRLLN